MSRELKEAAGKKYDVAVVGGGIHGAMIAALASVSGLSTVLLEQGDFCGRTSANSLKVIHGGLRYLQHMDLPRIRDSIVSRRWMLKNFPHLVQPLQCIMPTKGFGVKSRAAMTAGLLLNDILSCTRNRGVPTANHLGRGRVIGKSECREILRGADAPDITGGAVWYDAFALNTERIILELVHLLKINNGSPVNYVRVEDIHQKDRRSILSCRDNETGVELEFAAGSVINAAGPWCTQFKWLNEGSRGIMKGWSKAVNLVVRPQLFPGYGVALEGKSSFVDQNAVIRRGNRLFFFVPWDGKTMIGTVYIQQESPAASPSITREELQSILDEINQIYPEGGLRFDDITNYHVGLMPSLPAENENSFDVQLDKQECVVDHGDTDDMENVFTVKTVKYTTAFTVACKVLALLARKGILKNRQWRDRVSSPFPVFSQGEKVKIPPRLIQRYGRQAAEVYPLLNSPSEAGDGTGGAVMMEDSEIRYAVEHEMALHLGDVLFRRTGLAAGERPDDSIISQAADEMARVCQWDETRKIKEISMVKDHFAPLAVESC